MEKTSANKVIVTDILTRSKKSRDNNLTLYKHVLREYFNTDMKEITAHELFEGIATKRFPSYDSVTRCSRKVQETVPELRGEDWRERHKLEQPVIEDLNNNFKD